jgi:hypothetical protein
MNQDASATSQSARAVPRGHKGEKRENQARVDEVRPKRTAVAGETHERGEAQPRIDNDIDREQPIGQSATVFEKEGIGNDAGGHDQRE